MKTMCLKGITTLPQCWYLMNIYNESLNSMYWPLGMVDIMNSTYFHEFEYNVGEYNVYMYSLCMGFIFLFLVPIIHLPHLAI